MIDAMRAPRLDVDLELERSIALLPKHACVKGVYFSDVLRRASKAEPHAEILRRAGVAPRRWLPFFDYPYADWMRIAVVAAQALTPEKSPAEGMRELGRHAYDTLLDTQVGRVVFGVLGTEVSDILRIGPKGYAMMVNFGSVTAEAVGASRYRYRFREFPCFLETFQVGVLEGAVRHCKARGEATIDLHDLANADVDIAYG